MSTKNDPLYVGYLPEGPPELMPWVRSRVLWIVLGTAAVAALSALLMNPFAASRFEFGEPRAFTGRIEASPVPTLVVPRPNAETGSRFLLVAPFKHGADELIAGFDGRFVSLEGALIHRNHATMLELVPGTIRAIEEDATATTRGPEIAGPRTFEGEIVDSKCFLGVMKPGALKPHRACASLCIRGGIPPVLCVRDADGLAEYWVLVGPADEAINEALLPFVAEPVRVSGTAVTYGDLKTLRIDPQTITRL